MFEPIVQRVVETEHATQELTTMAIKTLRAPTSPTTRTPGLFSTLLSVLALGLTLGLGLPALSAAQGLNLEGNRQSRQDRDR